jgi:hypothetical protein
MQKGFSAKELTTLIQTSNRVIFRIGWIKNTEWNSKAFVRTPGTRKSTRLMCAGAELEENG